MQLSRRDFLKTSIPVSGLFLLGMPSLADLMKNPGAASPRPGEKAMLYDTSKCIGCRACVSACQKQNNLPPGVSYTLIHSVKIANEDERHGSFRKYQQCMHCTEATCVKVCPTQALTHHELGFVTYNPDRCIGCGYCAEFCPFQVPQLRGNRLTGIEKMGKCTFCADRVINNLQTACVEACPVNALTFGNGVDLIAQGRERVAELTKTYPNARFYGENELGGLHVMYILKDTPVIYQLPENPQIPDSAVAWKDVIHPLGWAVGGLSILGLGLNYIVARRAKRAEEPPGREE